MMAKLRAFFCTRGYLEVETPYLAQHGVTDCYLNNVTAHCQGKTHYLQTSPEYHMKRLLAAGSGPIFQLARVFRDDELGRWHNPEFTLLEWYQLDIDHYGLMDEVDVLLQTFLQTQPMRRVTYQAIFQAVLDLDPLQASIDDFRRILRKHQLDGVLSADETDRDQYLFLLMSHVIEPALETADTPVAVYHFPPSQASLSQIHEGLAARVEIFFRGVELANGFHELTDPIEQHKRFTADNAWRLSRNLPLSVPDPYLLGALKNGLPPCSGMALGVDRLITLALGLSNVGQTLAFDFSKS